MMRSSNLSVSKSPRVRPDIEPFMVVEAFDPDDIRCGSDWMRRQSEAAIADGAKWARYSYTCNPRGLLAEFWTERPKDEGDQRWTTTPTQMEAET